MLLNYILFDISLRRCFQSETNLIIQKKMEMKERSKYTSNASWYYYAKQHLRFIAVLFLSRRKTLSFQPGQKYIFNENFDVDVTCVFRDVRDMNTNYSFFFFLMK